MSIFTKTLVNLQRERKRMQQEIQILSQAISVLKRVAGMSQLNPATGRTHRISLAARRRIAAAQRARWEKFRQEKEKKAA
jgi:hypothetical protein